jgi:hypothetical protein
VSRNRAVATFAFGGSRLVSGNAVYRERRVTEPENSSVRGLGRNSFLVADHSGIRVRRTALRRWSSSITDSRYQNAPPNQSMWIGVIGPRDKVSFSIGLSGDCIQQEVHVTKLG